MFQLEFKTCPAVTGRKMQRHFQAWENGLQALTSSHPRESLLKQQVFRERERLNFSTTGRTLGVDFLKCRGLEPPELRESGCKGESSSQYIRKREDTGDKAGFCFK